MATTQQQTEIAELAAELADTRQHIEPVTTRDRHRNKTMRAVWVTDQPGLLDQLADTGTGTGNPDDNKTSRPHPGSRTPGRWEALAQHATICIEAFGWTVDIGIEAADTVNANVRNLASHAPHLDNDLASQLLTDLRRWRHTAAVLTGWAARLWAPNITCPIPDCGRTTTLRLNTERRIAYCTACTAQWDDQDGSYSTLTNYITAKAAPDRHRPNRIRSGRQGHGAWLTEQPA